MKHNEYLKKVLRVISVSENKEKPCTVFMEQAIYFESFRAKRSAEICKIASCPSTPPLFKLPSTLHEAIIEIFRIFLLLRRLLPMLLQLRLETELAMAKATEEEAVDVVGLATGGSVGVECYEDIKSILRTRVIVEARDGVSLLAPEYANRSGCVRITRKFSYTSLQIYMNDKIKTRLILKENGKNVVELIFASELKAAAVCDALNKCKKKYVNDVTEDILAYLDNCKILQ